MDHGGEVEMRLRLVAARYVHKASGGRQFYKKGDVFDCDGAAAERLLQIGAVVDADTENKQENGEVETAIEKSADESEKQQEDSEAPPERPKNAANLAAWQNYARALGQDPGKRTKDQLMTELP